MESEKVSQPTQRDERPRTEVRRRDVIPLLAFSLAWLLPVTYHGLHEGELMPNYPFWALHLTNISCLFTSSTPVWNYEYIQLQPVAGGAWVTVPEGEYFHMAAFGHRTRFDEMMRRSLGERSLQELLVWVRARWAERHSGPPPAGARIVAAYFRVGDPIPPGHWRKPPLDAVPAERRQVLYEVRFAAQP